LLDAFAGHDQLLQGVAKRYTARQEAAQNLSALEAKSAQASDDRAFLEHAIAELNRLDPKADEDMARRGPGGAKRQ